MLVLSRFTSQVILIGDDIRITVLCCDQGNVSLGIDAPENIVILREEVKKRMSAGPVIKKALSKIKESVLR